MKYLVGTGSIILFFILIASSFYKLQEMPFGGKADVKFANDLW